MAGIVTMKDNVKLYLGEVGAELTAANKVGNITQISDIGGESEEIDTTTIESQAKESENGFEDNGTVDITQNLTNDEYVTMDEYKKAGTEKQFGLTIADKKGQHILGLKGRAVVRSVKLTGISVGGLLQVNTTLKLNGEVETGYEGPAVAGE